MITINDVAKAAGVSTATVSRVVNNGPKVGTKTRAHVLQVMATLGYTPNANARALASQQSKTIGVVIPDLTDPFFASLANGVELVAREQGMQTLLSTGQQSADAELRAIQLLMEQRCDAMVVHSKHLNDDQLKQLSHQVKGFVLIDRYIDSLQSHCVWLDNAAGGKAAAEHFIATGHDQIAMINSNLDIDDPVLRKAGFDQYLNTQGIKTVTTVTAEPTLSGGELAARQLVDAGLTFTALFAYNDAMAIGAMSVLEDMGIRVPDDVAVIGFDDVLLSRYSRPKLATLRYPIQSMAKQAAKLALSLLRDEPLPERPRVYLPRLIVRASA